MSSLQFDKNVNEIAIVNQTVISLSIKILKWIDFLIQSPSTWTWKLRLLLTRN